MAGPLKFAERFVKFEKVSTSNLTSGLTTVFMSTGLVAYVSHSSNTHQHQLFDQAGQRLTEQTTALRKAVDMKLTSFQQMIDHRLDAMDGRLDAMDGKLDAMDGKLDAMDGKLNGMLNTGGALTQH